MAPEPEPEPVIEPPARSLLLFGATGQIGAGVLAAAPSQGRRVLALRHRNTAPRADDTVWFDGDLMAPPLRLPDSDTVALVHATGLWLLPAHLDDLRDAGLRRLVAFSTSSVIGKRDTRNPRERQVVADVAAAEEAVRARCEALGIAWTILRPTLVYGHGRDMNVTAAARFIDRFGVFPVAGAAAGLRQPVHADDLAAAALAAIDCRAAHGRTYYLCGGETLAFREMIGRIFDCLGRRRRIVPVPFLGTLAALWRQLSGNPAITADMARRMNRDLVFDDGPARRDFGYSPRGFLGGGRDDLGL
jgi:nucleoside-diphosphate-sugar epimerase